MRLPPFWIVPKVPPSYFSNNFCFDDTSKVKQIEVLKELEMCNSVFNLNMLFFLMHIKRTSQNNY